MSDRSEVNQIPMQEEIAFILFVSGLPLAYAGWYLYETVLALVGALFGLSIGLVVGLLTETPIGLAVSVVAFTFLFAIGFVYLIKLCYYVAGAAVGAFLLVLLTPDLPLLIVAGAIIGGVISWYLHKIKIILTTAALGSLFFGAGLFLAGEPASTAGYAMLFVLVTGFVFQYQHANTSSHRPEQLQQENRTSTGETETGGPASRPESGSTVVEWMYRGIIFLAAALLTFLGVGGLVYVISRGFGVGQPMTAIAMWLVLLPSWGFLAYKILVVGARPESPQRTGQSTSGPVPNDSQQVASEERDYRPGSESGNAQGESGDQPDQSPG